MSALNGLSRVAAQLDPDRFVRIHRSYIVNLDRVASIEPLDSGDARVHLDDGTELPCSRRQRDELRARIGAPGLAGRAGLRPSC